jgi:hypothetical protein
MTVILEDFVVIPKTGDGEPCESRNFEGHLSGNAPDGLV